MDEVLLPLSCWLVSTVLFSFLDVFSPVFNPIEDVHQGDRFLLVSFERKDTELGAANGLSGSGQNVGVRPLASDSVAEGGLAGASLANHLQLLEGTVLEDMIS